MPRSTTLAFNPLQFQVPRRSPTASQKLRRRNQVYNHISDGVKLDSKPKYKHTKQLLWTLRIYIIVNNNNNNAHKRSCCSSGVVYKATWFTATSATTTRRSPYRRNSITIAIITACDECLPMAPYDFVCIRCEGSGRAITWRFSNIHSTKTLLCVVHLMVLTMAMGTLIQCKIV